ncbi:MAG TPA: hypothetical protein VNH15_08230 [Elusimicrobiota bacterium]|nr:hypothetical protein [Elusimicrobiota bacterium]
MKGILLSLALILAQFPLPAFAGGGAMDAGAPDISATSMAVDPAAGLSPVGNINTNLNVGDAASLSALETGALNLNSLPGAQVGQINAQAAPEKEVSAGQASAPSIILPNSISAASTEKAAAVNSSKRQKVAAKISQKKNTAPAQSASPIIQARGGIIIPSKEAAAKIASLSKGVAALRELRLMAAGSPSEMARILAASAGGNGGHGAKNGLANLDVSSLKLGRKRWVPDPRTLHFKKYAKDVPSAPGQADFTGPVTKLGMMLNDKIGDCAVAAPGHAVQVWTANAGKEKTIPDSAILKVYEAPSVGNYNPNDPNSDQGANIIDVLKYWRKNGIGGDKLGAFLFVSPTNLEMFKKAVWLFGGGDLGINLPISAQKQVAQGLWDVPPEGTTGDGAPGSWGGHSVAVAGFDSQGVTIVTWGQFLKMTWAFFQAYCEESWAIVSKDFLNGKGVTPNNGFDWATLTADLKALGQSSSGPLNGRHPKPPRHR